MYDNIEAKCAAINTAAPQADSDSDDYDIDEDGLQKMVDDM